MPHQIEIPEALYEKLQAHARPFVDTSPASVIARWAEIIEASSAQEPPQGQQAQISSSNEVRRFDPLQPPELFYTSVKGEFNGQSFSKWNELVRIALCHAFRKTGSFEKLKSITHARICQGAHSDSGFWHIPSIDVSLQNPSANYAWQHAMRLAQYLSASLVAEVYWPDIANLAYPGERGVLKWEP